MLFQNQYLLTELTRNEREIILFYYYQLEIDSFLISVENLLISTDCYKIRRNLTIQQASSIILGDNDYWSEPHTQSPHHINLR